MGRVTSRQAESVCICPDWSARRSSGDGPDSQVPRWNVYVTHSAWRGTLAYRPNGKGFGSGHWNLSHGWGEFFRGGPGGIINARMFRMPHIGIMISLLGGTNGFSPVVCLLVFLSLRLLELPPEEGGGGQINTVSFEGARRGVSLCVYFAASLER